MGIVGSPRTCLQLRAHFEKRVYKNGQFIRTFRTPFFFFDTMLKNKY